MSYLPRSLGAILDRFQGTFTRPTFVTFCVLVHGWLLCTGRHTISRVIRAARLCGGAGHHARFYRFFSRAAWRRGVDALGRDLFALLVPYLPACIEAAVDDTLCHRTGPQIFGGGMHHDAAGSSYGRGGRSRTDVFRFGHNWVVLAVRVPLPWAPGRAICVPVLMRLYRTLKLCPQEHYTKRTELAREMLMILAGWLPAGRTLSLAGDTEYACSTLVRDLPKGAVFVGPVGMNAALYARPGRYRGVGRPRRMGKRLPSPRDLARRGRWREIEVEIYGRRVRLLVKTMVCLWYTVAATRVVRVVLTRDPAGRFDDRAFFATDSALSAAEILLRMSHRWGIEVCFRDAKQVLGLEDPRNGWWRRADKRRRNTRRPGAEPRGERGRLAVERTARFACTVYGLVVVWYLRHGRPTADADDVRTRQPWYRHKCAPSFADMVSALRLEIWRSVLSAYPLPEAPRRKVVELIAPFLAAA